MRNDPVTRARSTKPFRSEPEAEHGSNGARSRPGLNRPHTAHRHTLQRRPSRQHGSCDAWTHVTRNGGPHTYSMGYCDASSCWGSAAQVHAAWLLLLLSCHTEVLRHTHSAAMPLCRQLQVGGTLLPFAKAAPHPVYHHLVVHACKHHWRGCCQGRCGKCGPFCLTHDVRVLSGARERDSCVRICSGANTDDAFDACDGRGAPPARAAHPCTCPKAPRLVH